MPKNLPRHWVAHGKIRILARRSQWCKQHQQLPDSNCDNTGDTRTQRALSAVALHKNCWKECVWTPFSSIAYSTDCMDPTLLYNSTTNLITTMDQLHKWTCLAFSLWLSIDRNCFRNHFNKVLRDWFMRRVVRRQPNAWADDLQKQILIWLHLLLQACECCNLVWLHAVTDFDPSKQPSSWFSQVD